MAATSSSPAKRMAQDAVTARADKIALGFDRSGLSQLPRPLDQKLLGTLAKFETPLTYLAGAVGGKGAAAINAGLNVGDYSKIGKDIAEGLGGNLGKIGGRAAEGFGVGLAADSAVKLLGLRGSATGGALGGAIGGATGLPGGALIGGALGSLVGGLLKSSKTGSATINSVGGTASLSGNNSAYQAAASASASAVQDNIQKIISALGGTAGSFAVSIGQRDGKYVVDTNGTGSTKFGKANDGITAYKTEAEAQRAALLNAIQDGAVAGIRAGAQRLLKAGTDLDRQLQKAVDFEGVFTQLKQYTDPVGAAVDALDKQFTYLRSVFAEAGASTEEYSDLEKLYAFQRADAVKSASKDVTSTLQSLLDDLRYKGDNGLSLRTREKNAAAAFDPLAATVRGGGAVDQDAFADAAKSYLDIERQLYGSTSKYFDKLADITALTGQAITNVGGTIQGGPIVANDNASAAAAAAQAIYAQTDALKIPAGSAALFTATEFTNAVAAANAYSVSSAGPGTTIIQPSNADVVAAIYAQTAEQTATLRNGFELMIGKLGENGKASQILYGGGLNASTALRNA